MWGSVSQEHPGQPCLQPCSPAEPGGCCPAYLGPNWKCQGKTEESIVGWFVMLLR